MVMPMIMTIIDRRMTPGINNDARAIMKIWYNHQIESKDNKARNCTQDEPMNALYESEHI
jgi:hypothetical protein